MGAVWTLSAAGYLGYATLFGTIEEQMYYILLLPCVISVCVWTDGRVAERKRAVGSPSWWWRSVSPCSSIWPSGPRSTTATTTSTAD